MNEETMYKIIAVATIILSSIFMIAILQSIAEVLK
jgi:hypothetical protein